MGIDWWPALVFGWPGPILAIAMSAYGVAKSQRVWLLCAAVVLLPFSLYLGANPRVEWCVLLPVIPLFGAYAIHRDHTLAGWGAVALLTAVVVWLAAVVFGVVR